MLMLKVTVTYYSYFLVMILVTLYSQILKGNTVTIWVLVWHANGPKLSDFGMVRNLNGIWKPDYLVQFLMEMEESEIHNQ